MHAPKPARTTHTHPAHTWGRRVYLTELAYATATGAGLIALGMLAYAIWTEHHQ